jgi:hypothetical protein
MMPIKEGGSIHWGASMSGMTWTELSGMSGKCTYVLQLNSSA